MGDQGYHARVIEADIHDALASEPAVLLNGPRAVGKSTTARRYAADVVNLDDPRQAAPFRADPDRALSIYDRPLVIDEWQFVPEVMWAIKRAVDDGAPAGSFILTGSVNTSHRDGQPVFGRTRQLTMWPASFPEVESTRTDGLSALLTTSLDDFHPPRSSLSVDDYHHAIVAGGFPRVAFPRPPAIARATDMLTDISGADVHQLSPRAHVGKLAAWLHVNAVQSGQAPSVATMLDQVGVNRKTADRYDLLLQEMYVLELVPPFFDNRLKRLRKTPKRYLTDTGLACAAMGVTSRDLISDPVLAGHLLDTFVAAQLRALLPTAPTALSMHHLRSDAGAEVDIVLASPGEITGIEVTSTPNPDVHRTGGDARKARHLAALRDQLGDSFNRGFLLHTGPDTYVIDDRILATPICSLWAGPRSIGTADTDPVSRRSR